MFAGNCLNFSDFGKITGCANNSDRLVGVIENRFDRYQQWPIQARGSDFNCNAAAILKRLFHHAGFTGNTRAKNLTALPAEQSSRVQGLHCSASSIDALQFTLPIEDE